MFWKALPLVIVAAGTPARAEQPAYTMADVTACSKDAIRLCRSYLSDLGKIETCMRANIERLRPACRARFSQAH